MGKKNQVEATNEQDEAELAALLAGEDEMFEGEEEVVGDEITDEELEAVLAESEPAEPEVDMSSAEEVETNEEAETSEEPEKAKRVSTKGMKPSEALMTKLGDSAYETLLLNDADIALTVRKAKNKVNKWVEGIDVLPKKVAEKVVNASHHIANGVSLSVYTKIAIDLIKEHGTVDIVDIRNAYLDATKSGGEGGYSPGTASAQSSQMGQVLPYLGIATREGRTLTLVEDSTFAAFCGADVED